MQRRRRLVLRVYAFAVALAIAVTAAFLILPRYTRGARYLEPQAALLQYMVERWSLKDQAKFTEIMGRIEPRLRGKLSLYDLDGRLVRTNIEPALDGPSQAERERLQGEKWALSAGRIVVRSDDGTMIGVYAPNRPGFPWSYVLPMSALLLVLIGAASIWFARRLARPLDELAEAARRFGAGDTAARARLDRRDELGDVGRAFDEMADRTAAMLHAQRQLMADVSHELRTPLARIRVALELAAEDVAARGRAPTTSSVPSVPASGAASGAAQDVLADVGIDLDEIDQLIEDILTTARLDTEHAHLKRRPARLGELAERAAQRFTARHPGRKLETAVAADREIECDPALLRRAIDNLLDNAAKYSEPGTAVRLAVDEADGPGGPRARFAITDRGIGMSADELERAGTPFWRADGSRTRRTGGVGLGLALARRIARAHGGDVTLQSRPGDGTTARIDVPAAAAAS